jgi:hypothetical protein
MLMYVHSIYVSQPQNQKWFEIEELIDRSLSQVAISGANKQMFIDNLSVVSQLICLILNSKPLKHAWQKLFSSGHSSTQSQLFIANVTMLYVLR